MNQTYLDTARLLTQVAPLVFMDDTFALKGGTAINTGTYECTSNSLDTEEPTRLGRNIFLFEST